MQLSDVIFENPELELPQIEGYWYALQVFGGHEDKARKKIKIHLGEIPVLLPRRELAIRRGGVVRNEQKPLFPGYLFINLNERLTYAQGIPLVRETKSTGLSPTILRMVGLDYGPGKNGDDLIKPVNEDEMQVILYLTREGELLQLSKVAKEGSQIRVLSGPLKGIEGIVRSFDHRKKRIKISIRLFGKEHQVDLGAEQAGAIV
ncbi:MAG: antiterminator LoaP [Leptospiraceae bacterium]|nr:antiterminator LoaP [Leptospiraceae bacterium]